MTTDSFSMLKHLLGKDAPSDPTLLGEIAEAVVRGITIEAMSRMDEKTLEEFDRAFSNESPPEKLASFLVQRVPDIGDIARMEVNRLMGHYEALQTA